MRRAITSALLLALAACGSSTHLVSIQATLPSPNVNYKATAQVTVQGVDSKGRTTWTTVFRGSLIRIGFPKAFLGTTIVKRVSSSIVIYQSGGSTVKRIVRLGCRSNSRMTAMTPAAAITPTPSSMAPVPRSHESR